MGDQNASLLVSRFPNGNVHDRTVALGDKLAGPCYQSFEQHCIIRDVSNAVRSDRNVRCLIVGFIETGMANMHC